MSLLEYSKRRGVSVVSVQRAVQKGRLKACIVLVQTRTGKKLPKIGDPDLADREWSANSDYTDAPQRAQFTPQPATKGPEDATVLKQAVFGDEETSPDTNSSSSSSVAQPIEMSVAAARSKHWEAELKQLKFKEAARELVPAEDVKQAVADVFAECRTKILGVPAYLRQQDPSFTDAQIKTVNAAIYAALEALAAVE